MGRAYEVRKEAIAKTGAKKSKIYSMYSKEIYKAVQDGNNNPNNNYKLRVILERARKDQVPNEIINRALNKGNKELTANYFQIRYEAFSVGGANLIIDCFTDNVNRVLSNLRSIFTKTKTKLVDTGSVSALYRQIGLIKVKNLSEEEILEVFINEGVNYLDLITENQLLIIKIEVKDFKKVSQIIEELENGIFVFDEIVMEPMTKIKLKKEDLDIFESALNQIEELEDIINIFHNVENVNNEN